MNGNIVPSNICTLFLFLLEELTAGFFDGIGHEVPDVHRSGFPVTLQYIIYIYM